MRKTQPSFVVEYKGGRRRKQGRSKTIWGEIDFNTLDRGNDRDLAPVTGPRGVLPRLVPEHAIEPGMPSDCIDQSAVAPTPAVPFPDARTVCLAGNSGDTSGLELKPESPNGKAVRLPRTSPAARVFGSQASSAGEDVVGEQFAPSHDTIATAITTLPVSRQDLANLQAENQELRQLYQARLLSENNWLSEMLRRFAN